MDQKEFEAIVKACVREPRKLTWLEGFCAGLAAAESKEQEDRETAHD